MPCVSLPSRRRGDCSSGPISESLSGSVSAEEAAILAAMMSCLKLAGWILMSSILTRRECPPLLEWRLSLPLDLVCPAFDSSLEEVSSPNLMRREASGLLEPDGPEEAVVALRTTTSGRTSPTRLLSSATSSTMALCGKACSSSWTWPCAWWSWS